MHDTIVSDSQFGLRAAMKGNWIVSVGLQAIFWLPFVSRYKLNETQGLWVGVRLLI